MADDPPSDPTPAEPRPWFDRSRDVALKAWSSVQSGFRGLWKWLVSEAPRLWKWVLRMARKLDEAAAEGAPDPPPLGPIERRELVGPIAVPARGYVYSFTIRAAFTWSARDLRLDQLAWYAHNFRPEAIQKLTRIAGELSRTVEPHQAGDLEERLQHALSLEKPWPFKGGRGTITCRATASVELDEPVRELLQPFSNRQMTLDCENAEYTRRAALVEQLNRRWAKILEDLAGAEMPDSLREQFIRALKHTLAEQKAAAQWTSDLLRQPRSQENASGPKTDSDFAPPQQRSAEGGTQPTAAEGPPSPGSDQSPAGQAGQAKPETEVRHEDG